MVKINQLELENVKRIKAVVLVPTENGLTVIGGRNGQGKTSVLDAIAWALGGDRYKPSKPERDGSAIPPHLKVELSNGIIVERYGDSSKLKVTDKSGKKGGQQLLNEFIETLALDLPKFMSAKSSEKADILLKIIGVKDELLKLETEEQRLYNQRLEVGRIADRKEKYALEMPSFANAPEKIMSVSELVKIQQDILAKNGENQRKRENLAKIEQEYNSAVELVKRLEKDLETARRSAEDLIDESTAEIEQSIAAIEENNNKVRANIEREKAAAEAAEIREQYNELTEKLNATRNARKALLNGAKMPLEGLSVESGELIYNGSKWDCMSGSEQLKIATAIVRKLNPECGFVLLDKLEQMDNITLKEFGSWLEAEGLQAIATRVSTGEECSVIIEDGTVIEPRAWTAGKF